jgi:hypothetical protein
MYLCPSQGKLLQIGADFPLKPSKRQWKSSRRPLRGHPPLHPPSHPPEPAPRDLARSGGEARWSGSARNAGEDPEEGIPFLIIFPSGVRVPALALKQGNFVTELRRILTGGALSVAVGSVLDAPPIQCVPPRAPIRHDGSSLGERMHGGITPRERTTNAATPSALAARGRFGGPRGGLLGWRAPRAFDEPREQVGHGR